MFSKRLDWALEENELARALARKRRAGERVWDLTESNPTRAGIDYPAREILSSLARPEALLYEPSPAGLPVARSAVARYYASRGEAVAAESLVLTASTSEAYGYLFKLLCDPGDEVIVPRPSYPLFAFLAALDGVVPSAYALLADDDWRIDFQSMESRLSPRTRAILAVHPNNPTGSCVSADDREHLQSLARRTGLPLIVDEVFLDYPLDGRSTIPSFTRQGGDEGLRFVLGGLSKLAGLPQLKLAWIALSGDRARCDEARLRLEHIADNYLSVSTPIQWAAPRLLELAPRIAAAISERARANREALLGLVRAEASVTLLAVEGGWSQVVRLPAIETSEGWALRFLEEASVYVHPGAFFGFAGEAYVVVSLLSKGDVLETGVSKLLEVVSRRLRAGASGAASLPVE